MFLKKEGQKIRKWGGGGGINFGKENKCFIH